jgi:hypothetical protein
VQVLYRPIDLAVQVPALNRRLYRGDTASDGIRAIVRGAN